MDVDRWGRCSCCGKPSFHEFCNKCDGKAVQEDAPKIYCATCEDEIVDEEGMTCEGCLEDLHKDRDCPEDCSLCESEREHAEAMKDEKGCQEYTAWKEKEL